MPEVIDCQKIALQQPGPAVVDVPNMSHSFRIAFRAEATSKGIVIIDDITMEVRFSAFSLIFVAFKNDILCDKA